MLRVRARGSDAHRSSGGTLDLWPIHHLLDRKATVSIGVTFVRQRRDKRVA